MKYMLLMYASESKAPEIPPEELEAIQQTWLGLLQEAKAAVETWRGLVRREASLDNNSIDLAWLGRRGTKPLPLTPLPRDEGFAQPVARVQPLPKSAPAPKAVVPPRSVAAEKPVAVERPVVVAEQAAPAPSAAVVHQMPLPARRVEVTKERYPLLRNAM